MRRSHCEVTDPLAIQKILEAAHIGRLGTLDANGYPYITPVNFVFFEKCIYFHCAPKGEKLNNIVRHPRVCFEVDIPLAYLEAGFNPAKNPCQSHQLFHSVIIRGQARVVGDDDLKTAALNALMMKHEPEGDFAPITPNSSAYARCLVVEVRPEFTTAKSDLAQNKPHMGERRDIAEHLVRRGRPLDLDTVRAMGYALEADPSGGWRLK